MTHDLIARRRRFLRTSGSTAAVLVMTPGAIAEELVITNKTVKNHLSRIYDKLGVRTQAHAVSLAISQGLLTGRCRSAGTS